MLLDEHSCAEQTRLLAVVDQKNYGIFRSGPRFISACDFQHRRRANAIVGGSRPGRYRIVMRGEQYRRARRTSLETRDYIFDRRAVAILVAGKSRLNLWLVAEAREFIHHPATHDLIVCAPRRMRHAVAHQTVQYFPRAFG